MSHDPRDRERALHRLHREAPSAVLHALARRVLGATRGDSALVTLVGEHEQRFEAAANEPPDLGGGTPVTWAFCRLVCETGAPVIVPDAMLDPRFADNPLVATRMLRSYAGAPVTVPGYGTVGAVCILGAGARSFDPADVTVLELAADVVSRELMQRLNEETPEPAPSRDRHGPLVIDRRWQVLSPLGSGGQADVFVAREIGSGARVAVKIARDSQRGVLVEAQDLARRRHPNLVPVHAAGTLPDGRPYFVMDFVDGKPLPAVVSNLDGSTTARLINELAGALTALHGAGLLHGDVKPQNVMVAADDERAVLLDLGLGLRVGSPAERGGTPGWSAIEQFDPDFAGALQPSADTYGLATVAWFCLTGAGPFSHVGGVARLGAQAVGAKAPLPAAYAACADLFDRALSPDPAARPPTPLEFAAALDVALRGKPAVPGDVARSFSDTIRGVRAYLGRDVDTRTLAALSPADRDLVEGSAFEPTIPAEVMVAYLDACGLPLQDLAAAVLRREGRRFAAALRVGHEPTSIAQGLPGALARTHPWTRPTVTVASDAAQIHLAVPRAWRAVMNPWLAGAVTAMYARAGFVAKVAFVDVDDHVEDCAITWIAAG